MVDVLRFLALVDVLIIMHVLVSATRGVARPLIVVLIIFTAHQHFQTRFPVFLILC